MNTIPLPKQATVPGYAASWRIHDTSPEPDPKHMQRRWNEFQKKWVTYDTRTGREVQIHVHDTRCEHASQ